MCIRDRRSSVWVNQDLYFVMKFNKPVTDSIYLPMEETEKGKRLIMSFDMKPDEQLLMKVAISTVGVDGAHTVSYTHLYIFIM